METYTLITGASSGVGRELAVQLSHKHKLILSGRNYERLVETRDMCENKNEIVLWECDLSDTMNIELHLKKLFEEKKIKIDSFIHCAGIMKMLPCKMISLEAFEETYRVNVFSAALIVKVLASKRINQKCLRSVVFISSNISNRGAAAFGIYGSSKAALDGLMRNLAIELAPDIRVNSVLPGGMITEMTKDMFEDSKLSEKFQQNYPLGLGCPEKLYPLIELLLSEQSDWITGQQFVVDGGRTIDITER